jgi:hypothetical protein
MHYSRQDARLQTTIALTGAGRIPATNPKELRRLPEPLNRQQKLTKTLRPTNQRPIWRLLRQAGRLRS